MPRLIRSKTNEQVKTRALRDSYLHRTRLGRPATSVSPANHHTRSLRLLLRTLERLHAAIKRRSTRKNSPAPSPSSPATAKSSSADLRHTRHRQRRAHDQGHHLPRLLHDQARHRRGHDDPVRRGQVAALRPHLQVHSRVRQPQGLQGPRRRRQNDPRRSRPRPHHARADDPHRRLQLRRSATPRSTRCTTNCKVTAGAKPAGDDRQARQIPLNYQPGTRWRYSLSMDIQGYIVEKLSGQSLPDFMRDHIFAPARA